MRTIFFMRHGKAETPVPGISDFDRKLTDKGKENSILISKRIKHFFNPSYIVSSPAKRALQTAKIFAKEFEIPSSEISKMSSIYEAENKDLLSVVNNLNDDFDTVVLFGHNPAFSSVIGYLTGKEFDHLPTSGIAGIRFEFDEWKLISKGTGDLIYFDHPKA